MSILHASGEENGRRLDNFRTSNDPVYRYLAYIEENVMDWTSHPEAVCMSIGLFERCEKQMGREASIWGVHIMMTWKEEVGKNAVRVAVVPNFTKPFRRADADPSFFLSPLTMTEFVSDCFVDAFLIQPQAKKLYDEIRGQVDPVSGLAERELKISIDSCSSRADLHVTRDGAIVCDEVWEFTAAWVTRLRGD